MTTNKHKYYDMAYRAYAWTSFSPERRAESECQFFDEIAKEFADDAQFLVKFERLFLLSLSAKSRCMSSMITGPARFPTQRATRANDREHRITSEMLDYIKRVREAKAKEAYYLKHPEARPVLSSDSDAVERLQDKLEKLQKLQADMVQANKLVRKGDKEALKSLLPDADIELLFKPDFCGRVGFADYMLTNNNAKIKATKERIAGLEKRKATAPKDLTINGVRVLENIEAMRLQLFFDGKPKQETIKLLKSHGFKWSPSNVAWQRQLTNNAVYSFNNFILPAIRDIAAAEA